MNLSQEEIVILKSEQKSESRIFLVVNDSNQLIQDLVNNYSSLTKIKRILARFISNCKLNYTRRDYNNISTKEIYNARKLMIIKIQETHFAGEISDIRAGKRIRSDSKLFALIPFK